MYAYSDRAGLVRQVKESHRVREISRDERHPLVGMSPGAGAFIEIFAWPIEGARDYAVSDAFARALRNRVPW